MVSATSHHMSLLLWVRRVALAVISIVLFGGISDFDRSLFAKQQGMTPTEQVQSTVAELLNILHEWKDPSQIRERRREIEQVVRRHVNYEQMAKRSLGEAWTVLTGSQRDEFVGLFVQLIRNAFANRLCEYSDQEIRYLSEQRGPQFASVGTRLSGHKPDMSVDFRLMHQPTRGWLLYDGVIDGVSIVDNYRAQFAAITRELSYAGLISQMKQRILLVKLFEKDSCL